MIVKILVCYTYYKTCYLSIIWAGDIGVGRQSIREIPFHLWVFFCLDQFMVSALYVM